VPESDVKHGERVPESARWGDGPDRPNEKSMTDPIEINRWNWDECARIHSGAQHFVTRHGYRTYDYASAKGLVDPVLSQYERETAVADAPNERGGERPS
jgi:hypothetical protein